MSKKYTAMYFLMFITIYVLVFMLIAWNITNGLQ